MKKTVKIEDISRVIKGKDSSGGDAISKVGRPKIPSISDPTPSKTGDPKIADQFGKKKGPGTKVVGGLPPHTKLPDDLIDRIRDAIKEDDWNIGKTCFIAGTPINTPTGCVAIEELKIGDTVVAWNEEDGSISESKISQLHKSSSKTIIISLSNGKNITTTSEHPFYVEGDWVKASELTLESKLMDIDGKSVDITSIEEGPEETVYNISVEIYECYFAHNILVHNKTIIKGDPKPPGDGPIIDLPPDGPGGPDGPEGDGDGGEPPKGEGKRTWDKSPKELEREVDKAIRQGLDEEEKMRRDNADQDDRKRMGGGGGGSIRDRMRIEEIAKLDWAEIIKTRLTSYSNEKSQYKPYHRRFVNNPGMRTRIPSREQQMDTLPALNVVLDTSGSMSPDELSVCIAEIGSALSAANIKTLNVILWHTRAYYFREWKDVEKDDFSEVIDDINNNWQSGGNHVDVVYELMIEKGIEKQFTIHLTDGYIQDHINGSSELLELVEKCLDPQNTIWE